MPFGMNTSHFWATMLDTCCKPQKKVILRKEKGAQYWRKLKMKEPKCNVWEPHVYMGFGLKSRIFLKSLSEKPGLRFPPMLCVSNRRLNPSDWRKCVVFAVIKL